MQDSFLFLLFIKLWLHVLLINHKGSKHHLIVQNVAMLCKQPQESTHIIILQLLLRPIDIHSIARRVVVYACGCITA